MLIFEKKTLAHQAGSEILDYSLFFFISGLISLSG